MVRRLILKKITGFNDFLKQVSKLFKNKPNKNTGQLN